MGQEVVTERVGGWGHRCYIILYTGPGERAEEGFMGGVGKEKGKFGVGMGIWLIRLILFFR